MREFPSGPVIRLHAYCGGHRFDPLSRKLGSCKPRRVAQKERYDLRTVINKQLEIKISVLRGGLVLSVVINW